MEKAEYKNIFELEDKHFFYVANHKIILSQVKKYFKNRQDNVLQILDAGCGSGLLAKKLGQFGNVIAVDISEQALKFAKKRAIQVKKASITKLPFRNNYFHLITCVDVIYHQSIKDDNLALKEFYRVLKPNGILIIRVPANQWLKRSADDFVHTRQRYDYAELKLKLLQAGFKIEKLSFINMLLFPPVVISYFLERKSLSKKSPLIKLPPILNDWIGFILSLEAHLINKINLPFGLGLLAVARKLDII